MEKISTAQVATVLDGAAQQLRKLAARNDELARENAQLKKEARVQALVGKMSDKGMLDLEPGEKVAELLDLSEYDLSVAEKAVDMAGPNGVKLASVDRSPTNYAGGQTGAKFQSFLLTREDPE